MTFYYHFQDIYDLVEWSCEEDARQALANNKTAETWQTGLANIMFAVRDNKLFVMNVYRCVSAERIQRFLQPVTSDLIEGVVDEHAAGMKISQADRDFISGFFAHALDDYPRGRYGPEAVRFRCCSSWHRCRGAPLCAEPFLFGGRRENAGGAPERRGCYLAVGHGMHGVVFGGWSWCARRRARKSRPTANERVMSCAQNVAENASRTSRAAIANDPSSNT